MNYCNSYNMLKLYSKFPNSSKLIIKIPKLIKLKNNIRGNKKKILIYNIGLSWVKWVPKKKKKTIKLNLRLKIKF